MGEINNLVLVFLIVFSFIILITNDKLIDYLNTEEISILKKKIKVKKIILKFLVICFLFGIIINNCIQIKDNIKYYLYDTSEFDKIILNSKEKIQKENDFYNQIMLGDYSINNCKEPYIPENFIYVEGEWNTGFVVQDENQNQYVWIPCSNIRNDENIEILKNSSFSSSDFIKHFDCYEEHYEEFLNSTLVHGGFYISRFEIGKDDKGNPVSKSGYEILNNITREEAIEISKNMQQNINSELINGYAYDTALNWILNTENVEISFRETEPIITGTNAYKNIYDIMDNIYEFSTESNYGEVICRGIISDNKYIVTNNLDNRISCDKLYYSKYIGFRTILYK